MLISYSAEYSDNWLSILKSNTRYTFRQAIVSWIIWVPKGIKKRTQCTLRWNIITWRGKKGIVASGSSRRYVKALESLIAIHVPFSHFAVFRIEFLFTSCSSAKHAELAKFSRQLVPQSNYISSAKNLSILGTSAHLWYWQNLKGASRLN